MRYSKTLRCCCFSVATTVIMLATKRDPASLCVPKLVLRHCTPGRIARSAVLLVGSTPSTCTNVHNASRRFRMSRTMPSQYLSIDNSNDRAERGGWLTAPGHPESSNVRPQHGGWPGEFHGGYVCRANGDALPVAGPSQTPSIAPQALLGSGIVL